MVSSKYTPEIASDLQYPQNVGDMLLQYAMIDSKNSHTNVSEETIVIAKYTAPNILKCI